MKNQKKGGGATLMNVSFYVIWVSNQETNRIISVNLN
jgi:hypothetical protein